VRRKGFSRDSQKADYPENRINGQIRVPQVRVIGPNGELLGIMSSTEALVRSREANLDLVEVAPTADPPVCKIMDYGKFRYQQQKRAHEAKKKQTVIQVKEIKVRSKIDEHDYQFKLQHVKRFLSDGDKAKISVVFRGREIVHKDLGQKLLDRFIGDIKELGEIESAPEMEGKNLTLLLTPKSQKTEKKANQQRSETDHAKDENP
jgi:translation initiation factor IF-3